MTTKRRPPPAVRAWRQRGSDHARTQRASGCTKPDDARELARAFQTRLVGEVIVMDELLAFAAGYDAAWSAR